MPIYLGKKQLWISTTFGVRKDVVSKTIKNYRIRVELRPLSVVFDQEKLRKTRKGALND